MDRYAVKCRFCGYKHEFEKLKCPAWGKVCEACKGRNHFKAVCKKTVKIVKEKNEEADEGYDHYMWMAPVEMKNSNRLTALLIVNDTEVRFHLDTGADVNAICQRYVKKDQVRPTSVKLAMWNKSKLSPIGETTLNVKNPKNDEIRSVTFIVVSNDLMCLFGSKTCQEMGFVFVNGKAFVSKIDIDHEMSNLGDLGEVKLNVDSALPARILPCRRLPIALKSKVQKELHSLVKRGVLIPETEPTDWVSQMAVVQKTNGKLRICIDPQPLNKALKREYYTLPILEDILPSLKHAKIFSKLDVQEAFWHIRLDEESSKLTTMITPFGRYRWARLPFGLKVSSEIFQRKLNEALEGLRGVYCVADDIVVVGFGNEEHDTMRDHEQNLQSLQKRCQEKKIKLNEEKSVYRKKEIAFMGHRLTSAGVTVDENKVKAIKEMPAPTDISGIRRFCGMVQYLSRFLPNLADDLEPVYYQNPDKKGWEKGLISHAQGNRSYVIEGKEGGIYRRNRIHIRPTTQDSSAIPEMEETSKLRETNVNDEQTCYHPVCDMPKLPRRSARLQEKMKGE
ncbi:uncharacterized protein [Palaemon carinicauda]|uniref:uncharacterized protein n=1 Tax=Palaemon carinicauda TaxID=392227 RepID=UPI0035B656DD